MFGKGPIYVTYPYFNQVDMSKRQSIFLLIEKVNKKDISTKLTEPMFE